MSIHHGAAASLTLVVLLGAALASRHRPPSFQAASMLPEAAAASTRNVRLPVALGPAAFGRSGALRVREVLPGERLELPLAWSGMPPGDAAYRWQPVEGTAGEAGAWQRLGAGESPRAPARPGVYQMEVRADAEQGTLDEFRVIVEVPFARARDGYLGGYHVGSYPLDRRYAAPAGFIEVTRANADLPLSRHLRLRQFLTHDQAGAWPKYAVVDTRLLDKLELVLAELERMGVPARRLYVMSGYRTPQYNQRGLGHGRAVLSRHQYGDAADVWVDNDGDGYMDDLNGDGRRDVGDAAVMLRAVERVERAHPELVGGAGLYRATRAHGPFIHIDTRGKRARWGGATAE